jgi:hypothetical protein
MYYTTIKEGKNMKTLNSTTALVKAMNKKVDAERASELQRIDVEIKNLEYDILEERRDSSTVYCGWGTQHDQLMEEWNEVKNGFYAWDEVKEEIVWEV